MSGLLAQSMAAAGLDAKDVKTIVVSHFHPDHIFGLMEKGTNAPVFPNAEIIENARNVGLAPALNQALEAAHALGYPLAVKLGEAGVHKIDRGGARYDRVLQDISAKLTPAIATWPTRVPSGRALGALVALGVICTAFAFLVFLALIREAGTSRAMVFTYVNPAVAVAAGVAFLSEPFTVTIAASFALILAGSLLATWTARDPETPDDPEAVSRRRPPRLRFRSSDPASPVR